MNTDQIKICSGCNDALMSGKSDFLVCRANGDYFVLAQVVEKPCPSVPWGVTIRTIETKIIPSMDAAEFCCGAGY